MGQRSEIDKVIAYLYGMAKMAREDPRTQGMIGGAIAASMRAAAENIRRGMHDDADDLWPEFLPPETVRQQPPPPRAEPAPAEPADEEKLAGYMAAARKADASGSRSDACEAELQLNLLTAAEKAEALRRRKAS